jgi:hypothetical protein
MGIFAQHTFGINISPQPIAGTHIGVDFSPINLLRTGFNFPVEISIAGILRKPPLNMPFSSVITIAHFDTGASVTSIDIELAKYLNLPVMGQSENRTASGPQKMPIFTIDISFPSTQLSPINNLRISSCKLGFDIVNNMNPSKPQNMGILIGRDIMSRWNIVWNGPTSTVIISD